MDVEYFNCRISILCETDCEYKASPEDCNRLYNGLPNLKTLRFDQVCNIQLVINLYANRHVYREMKIITYYYPDYLAVTRE